MLRTLSLTSTSAKRLANVRSLSSAAQASNSNLGNVRAGHEFDVEQIRPTLVNAGIAGAATADISLGQFKHGQSNPTYTLNISGEKFVLRKKPSGKLLRGAHAVEREYEIMTKLGANTNIPVPRTRLLEEDENVIGTSFMVYDYVPGQFYADCTMKDAPSPETRAALYDSMIQTVADFHNVDYKAAGLEGFGKEGGYLPRQTKVWTAQYRAAEAAAKAPTNVHVEKLIPWLAAALPKDDDITTLVHGDLRVDNMIFDLEQRNVAAVLDWELSTLGHPATDLALLCTPYHTPVDMPILGGLGDKSESDLAAMGVPTEQQLLDSYVEKGGSPAVREHLDYYYAFASFRMASILQGVYAR
jgi:aminoglycoside phosphotransferase (APT) family kinase protein